MNSQACQEHIIFFAGSDGRRLLGVIYHPWQRSRQAGVLYIHPFAEEHNMSHAVMVKSCRALAAQGYPVMRFDLSGCGDSEGALEDVSCMDWLRDLDAARDVFLNTTGIENVALFGLRVGGGLALLHAIRQGKTSSLILWEPVLDFDLFIRQFFRRAISTQIAANSHSVTTTQTVEQQVLSGGLVHVIGYPISKNLYDSFCHIGKEPFTADVRCPMFILSVSLMDHPSTNLVNYYNTRLAADMPIQLEHIHEEPFWDRYWRWECPKAIETTLEWLAGRS
jgi:uncharacterized protein